MNKALFLAPAIAILLTGNAAKAEAPGIDKPIQAERPEQAATAVYDLQPLPLGDFTITAYCSCSICCGQWSDGTTATGTRATAGRTIATDPAVIPAGSHVAVYYEDGAYAEYIAEDTGSGVNGQHIDVYYNTHQEALQHGVRAAQVYLLKE